MILLIVLAVNAILGLVAGSIWQRKGGRYGLGFLMGLIGGFVGLGYVIVARPED